MSVPDFETDGAAWPNRSASRFVQDHGLRWHVQIMGTGPVLLLLHGTGAATHSWRDLAPRLAERFTVVMPDLPGHGFTELPDRSRMSLGGMSSLVASLLRILGLAPALAVGHSAGAAILLRMAIDGRLPVRGLVALNGALMPLPSAHRTVFPVVARLVASTPGIPWLMSRQASRLANVDRLLASTGSRVPRANAEDYASLMSKSRHVSGALGMMSRWDLAGLSLERVHVPVLLVAGEADRMVPAADADRAAARLPEARVVRLPGLGHLAHEEQPDRIARLIEEMWDRVGPDPAPARAVRSA